MRGVVQTMTVATPASRQERYYTHSTLGFYGQDDFKMNSRLTLNLGLRYEFATIPQEGDGLGSSLRDPLHDSSTTLGPALFGENPSLHNFSPRVGFAWDVAGNGKTAVRGAFALLYDIDNHFGTSMLTQAGSMPPFSTISSGSNFTITSLPVSVPATKTIRQADYHMTQPHMLQYNLSVQRQLPFQTALTVSYAGSRGINLIGERDANPTIPNGIIQNGTCVDRPSSQAFDVNVPYCWKGTETRINPAWGYVRFDTTNNNSWYHSLQVSAQKQMSHGLQFQSSYTYSKVIDTTQGIVPADSSGDIDPTDPLNQTTDRARAAFDATHNWRFNTMYQLPKMASGALGAVVNSWSLSSIISMQSGYPFSVMLQRNRSMSQSNDNGADRPNLVPGIAFHDITRGVYRAVVVVALAQLRQGPGWAHQTSGLILAHSRSNPQDFSGAPGETFWMAQGSSISISPWSRNSL
jgi:outer membrane receptor protein involved in Fe transport